VEAKAEWKLSMDDEKVFLMKNQMSVLTELPESKRALHNKWVSRLKKENDAAQ